MLCGSSEKEKLLTRNYYGIENKMGNIGMPLYGFMVESSVYLKKTKKQKKNIAELEKKYRREQLR